MRIDIMGYIKKLIIVSQSLLFSWIGNGQNEIAKQVRINDPIPNFTLKDIEYSRNKELSSTDLRGKDVILCFWSRFCSGAYKNFSVMNELAKEFQGELEIIMIGGRENQIHYNNKEEIDSLKAFYKRTKKLQNLKLPVVYDLDLYQRFVPRGVPHLIWIDKTGIVKAVTASIDSIQIRAFLKGEPFDFRDASYDGMIRTQERADAYDFRQPFLVDGNGGESGDFVFRSLITPYTGNMPQGGLLTRNLDRYPILDKLEGIASLINLYKLAYFGYYWNYEDWFRDENYNQLILDIREPNIFDEYSYSIPYKNIYWYSLIVPKYRSDSNSLKWKMQQDLEYYFGYKARIERKKMPYWRITAKERTKKRIRTSGGQYKVTTDQYTYLGVQNIPFTKYLKMLLVMIAPASNLELPIIDETGIDFNVDIQVTEVDKSEFSDIKRVLRQQGFNIEMTEKDFNVLIIEDRDNMNFGKPK